MRTDNPRTIYLRDYTPPEYLIDKVELTFRLNPDATLVDSRLYLRRNPAAGKTGNELRLDGEQLELQWLKLDDQELSPDAYRTDATSLTLFNPPPAFVLETRVCINPQGNTELEGLYRSSGMYCTQCEAEGFRRITYFLDRPDVMARFRTCIIADKREYPVMLSNGNLVIQEDLEDGRHQTVWEDPFPKPSYLFALVAGDLHHREAVFTTASGRKVDLRIYVEPENIDRCQHAMDSLINAMAWDEKNYGREYDLDIYMIVAVNDFNMGAMENKGLNVFNSKYVLAKRETATDQDFQGIEGVIAHEYFHNWTGNRITCRDWFQLSLKEGLTVFRDQEFSADMGSRGVKRIEDVRLLRAHQFMEDAGPMAHPVRPDSYIEINNFYTVTVYEKGAEVVRMQRNLLGPERYRQATDHYFSRHDGQAVTTDDFVRCMEDVSGRDLTQFKRWYSQAGTPVVKVESNYSAETKSYCLTFHQSCPATPGQPEKEPFHIPILLALLNASGDAMPLRLTEEEGLSDAPYERVIELTEPAQSFLFHGLEQRPVPSLLRGFSAPVRLEYAFSDEELKFLMAGESDPFNRWDAAQRLMTGKVLNLIEAFTQGHAPEVDSRFLDAFSQALTDTDEDQALLAEVLTLPSEAVLGDQMELIAVESIHRAREWLKHHLAETLREDFLAVYHANQKTGPYTVDAASIARRSLKNLALGYLMTLDDPAIRALCLQQFESTDNMTDRMAALRALVNLGGEEAERALASFEHRWRDDPLVMDKWFAVQAGSKLPGTLSRVKELMRHPAFSLRNPNKVRSLIGVFCGSNIIGFHAADGSGYRFLGDQVLALDPLNPQVAARMIRLMSRWRRYDEGRQSLMRGELERVLAQPGLSRDVYEIASKSLN